MTATPEAIQGSILIAAAILAVVVGVVLWRRRIDAGVTVLRGARRARRGLADFSRRVATKADEPG